MRVTRGGSASPLDRDFCEVPSVRGERTKHELLSLGGIKSTGQPSPE